MPRNVLVLLAVMFIFLGSLFRRSAPKLCESEIGLVCCDGYFRDQSTGTCISCKPGYFDVNCSQRCFYPTYGVNCQEECSCQKTFCDFSSGCNIGDVTNVLGSTLQKIDSRPPCAIKIKIELGIQN